VFLVFCKSGPSPGFSSKGAKKQMKGPKARSGGHIFKVQYWLYVATGKPNVKWGAPISNGGAGHHFLPRWRRPCCKWLLHWTSLPTLVYTVCNKALLPPSASFAINAPFYVRNCVVPPDHVRSEISSRALAPFQKIGKARKQEASSIKSVVSSYLHEILHCSKNS